MATLLESLASHEEFTTFAALVRKTPLVAVLTEPGPFTIFAPTDDAFDNLPEGEVNRLLQDEDKLTTVLAYHIVPGSFTSDDAARLSSAVTTLEGSDLRVASTSIDLTVNGAHMVHTNIAADNGVLHGIDQVLVPLDDLGNVVVDYEDVMVVAPETVVVMSPAPVPVTASSKATTEKGEKAENAKAADESDESDESDEVDM